jgi:hypothetical protein
MDRKQFLKTAGRIGVACCGLSLLPGRADADARQTVAGAAAPVTPDARKVEWAKLWTKRFFDVLDDELDEPTRRRIMEHNGTACHRASLKGATPHATLDQLVRSIAEHSGPDSIRREGDTVYFNYVKNERGLKVADGYCLCPLVEDGPPGLSKTFCYCSVGYVRDMFETITGRKAKVELLESVRSGGKACRFRVDMLT